MPPAPPRHAPALGRRRLLAAALTGTGALLLAACGPVRLGQPEAYTPPPPGIDDLYREDLLAALEVCRAGAEQLAASPPSTASDGGGSVADPAALASSLDVLQEALPQQRSALLTGAEQEKEDAGEDVSPVAPSTAPQDPPALVQALVDLRDLCVDAARQVSGALARPVAAIGAHAQFEALRIARAAGGITVSPPLAAEDIVATREAPTADPASIGAPVDYEKALQEAQDLEWYSGYACEVLASRLEDEEQEQQIAAAALHRGRAEALGAIAEEDGAPVVVQEPVYALPEQPLTAETAAQLPRDMAQSLLIAHLALTGAAPFERRPIAIAAALEEAVALSSLQTQMAAVPSLEAED